MRPLGVRLEPVRAGRPGGCIEFAASSSPDDALPQVLSRKKSLGGGAASGTVAALSTGGLVSTHELDSGELAIWVISFIVTDPRGTRAGRLQGSPTTTLTPPLGPTTEVKRHSARRQQFDHWTRYLNAAKANLEFPSQPFAGFGAVTFPRDILPTATRYSCSPTAHNMDTSNGGPSASQQPRPNPAPCPVRACARRADRVAR